MNWKIALLIAFLMSFFSSLAQSGSNQNGSDFSTNDTIGCVPHVANFQSNVPNATSWHWDFGDGTSSILANPTKVYSTAGLYNVTLTATLSSGGTFQLTKTNYIDAADVPNINLTATNLSSCLSNNVIEIQNNTLGIAQHLWDMGDGTIAPTNDITHHYQNSGNHNITYFAINAQGCMSDTTFSHVVFPSVNSNIVTNGSSNSCDPAHIFNLSAQPSGLTSYSWELSDGSNHNGTSIQHAFNTYGQFNATLITEDQNGCLDTITVNNIVAVDQFSDDFTSTTQHTCLGTPINFTAQAPGATSVSWDFGDGNFGSGNNVNHTYANNGSYTVTMTTVRPNGCGQVEVKTNYATVSSSSNANIIASSNSVCANEIINFSSTAGSNASLSWDFGDGNTSNQANPIHHYSSAGSYNVQLIHGVGSCMDTTTQIIQVSQPTASFQNINFASCAPANITFNNFSTNAVSSYWLFSDGQTSTLQDPQVVFNQPGNFDAELIVSDINGCTDTSFVQNAVTISNNSPVGFQSGHFEGCAPFSVSFFDYSIGSGSWSWDFGDGNTSNTQSTNNTFYFPGDYVVSLNTIDSLGCGVLIDTFALVTVNSLLMDSTAIALECDSLQADFYVDCPECITGVWDFGDGINSGNFIDSHTYGSNMTYTVSFTGISNQGCVGKRFFVLDLDSCFVQYSTIANNMFQADGDGWTDSAQVGFTPASYYYCAPITLSIDNPVPTAQNWIWHFGDGNVVNGFQPQNTYDTTGTFSLMLEYQMGGVWDTLYYHNYAEINGHTNSILINSTNQCNSLEANIQSQDQSLMMYNWSLNNQQLPITGNSFDTTFVNSSQLHSVVLTTIDSNYCSYSTSAAILTQNISPFFVYDSTICLGDSLIINHNLPSFYNVTWDFGNGNSSAIPEYLYTTPGQYEVSASLIDTAGCQLNFSVGNVNVYNVNSFFTYNSSDNICVGDTISISAIDQNNDSYNWNLNNVSIIQGGANLIAVVDQAGTFDIALESSLNGCISNYQSVAAFTAHQAVANFDFIQDGLCLPITADFNDMSLNPTSWNWEFGDGNTSQIQNPSHLFVTNPTDSITLTITDNYGCSASISKENIDIFKADFDLSDTFGCAPAAITFTDASQNAINWLWNFGDGTTSSIQNPSHTYINEGTYDVSLIVESADGCWDTLIVPNAIQIDRVAADFASSVNAGCAPQPAFFTDNSYNASSWDWNFGNNSSSNLQDPIQVYYAGGNYNVELIATSLLGCSDTAQATISVMGPQASFQLMDSTYCEGESLIIQNNTQNVISTTWTLGDGTTSTQFTPQHNYVTSGSYEITLIVADSIGCQNVSSQNHYIEIGAIPNPSFTISDTVGCNPLAVTTSAIANGVTTQWSVNGSSSGSAQGLNTSLNTGTNNVTLVVESALGCIDSSSIDVTVHPVHTAAITPIPAICESDDIVSVSSALSMGEWYLNGELNSSNVFDVSNLTPGDYQIVQTIDTYCGSSDTATLHIDSLITAEIAPTEIVCENDPAFNLNASSNLGFWSGPGVIDPFNGILDPSSANVGANQINYTIINGGCTFIDTSSVVVSKLPNNEFTVLNPELCEGMRLLIESPENPITTSYNWTFSNGTTTMSFDDKVPFINIGPGNWNVELEVSNQGCIATSEFNDLVVHDNVAPHTPKIIRSTVQDNEAVLTEWEDPHYGGEKITGFQIWKSTDSVSYDLHATLDRSERSYLDVETNVHEQNYFYMVIPTNVCKVKPELHSTSSSILLKLEDLGNGQIQFDWNQYYKWETGVDYYELQRLNDQGVWETVEKVDSTTNTITIQQP